MKQWEELKEARIVDKPLKDYMKPGMKTSTVRTEQHILSEGLSSKEIKSIEALVSPRPWAMNLEREDDTRNAIRIDMKDAEDVLIFHGHVVSDRSKDVRTPNWENNFRYILVIQKIIDFKDQRIKELEQKLEEKQNGNT